MRGRACSAIARCQELTLTLLVSRIVTNDHDATMPADDLAVIADLLNARLDLHSVVLSWSLRAGTLRRVGGLLVAVNDPAARKIVGRKLYDDAVFRKDLDVVLAHLP